ncbi:MAG: hypothetical protein WAN36_04220 [Calditrichia bacterium]
MWAGLIIAFFNALAGAAVIRWGFNKPDKQFYGAFFGGMIIRFILMFLALFILVLKFEYRQIWLIASLMVAYFCFLILEVWEINKLAAFKGKNINAE